MKVCRLAAWLAAWLILTPGAAFAQAPPVRVGAVLDGPGPLNQPVMELLRASVQDLTQGGTEVQFPADRMILADWTAERVRQAMDDLLADPTVDLVLAMGVLASYDAVGRGPLPKPVIAPFILNVDREGVPQSGGGSGVRNLSYLVLPRTFGRDLQAFAEIAPAQKLAVLFSDRVAEGLPRLQASIEAQLTDLGIPFQSLLVGDDVSASLSQLDDDVDGVFVMPLVHLPSTGLRQLADGLIDRRIPSFSLLGRRDVEQGIMASLNPDIFDRLSRRVALHLHNILLGDPAEELTVAFAAGERLTLNTDTADRIGLAIRWGVLTQADLVGETETVADRRVGLATVVEEALARNRDLAVRRREVAAAGYDVSIARSTLLPQADIGLTHVTIDEDRASPFGAPERALTGSASFSQLLWSEGAWANRSIQSSRQESREEDLRSLELDVVQTAVTAYLQVLKASSLEHIQRDNLQLTRSNLELAEVRELVGQSGPAEVLRFQSQLASNTRQAIAANAQRNVAEIQLNRVLNHPLESAFDTAEADLTAALETLRRSGLLDFFQSKSVFGRFREFLVTRALDNSPEVRGLDAAIAAQSRAAASTSRALWSPTLAVSGEIARRLEESGAGTDPAPAALGLDPDDTDWNLALSLTFPLLRGGEKFSTRRQAHTTLTQLELQREAVVERIEQRTRTALHLTGASFAGIEQAHRAAEAADRSLEVVRDAYGQGVVSILDLLDAQTNALVADEQAATAVFDFFVDLMEVQRAIGELTSMLEGEPRRALVQAARAAVTPGGGGADPPNQEEEMPR